MGNQTLGRGKVYFSLFTADDNTFIPAGFRYIGNTPEFNLTIDNETLDHFSSDEGIRIKDRSIILETTSTGSLVCDDISLENLALFFFGSTNPVTQTQATAQSYAIADIQKGMLYQIGRTNALPTGVRSVTVTAVVRGVTQLVAGTDFLVDNELGHIEILASGTTLANGDDITITYNRAAVSRTQVISGAEQVKGALKFVSTNPEGQKMDYLLPYVRLSPNGDFALKSDEWQQLPLNVEILKANNLAAIYIDGRPFAA